MKQPQQFYQQKRKPTYKLNQMLRGAQGKKTKKNTTKQNYEKTNPCPLIPFGLYTSMAS